MQRDMNKVLIESMLKKATKNMQSSPGRIARNLIDLAVNFSKGRFQKPFLCTLQTMLRNQESQYYRLLTDVVSNVDMDLMIKFGMNLGYNGCTKGAETIRKIEAEKGFNVPWSLMLNIDSKKIAEEPEVYPQILQQGVSLGIHAYWLSCRTGNPDNLIPLFEGQPECAFAVLLHGRQITENFLEHVKESKNVIISVYHDEDAPKACETLRQQRLLYGVQQRYTEKDLSSILNGEWISGVLSCHPQFAFLSADADCSEEIRRGVHQYVVGVRQGQEYPVMFIDAVSDAWMIDNIISDDAYVVGFECDGSVRTYNGQREEKEYNIFEHSLEDILRLAAKKRNLEV